MLFNKIRSVTDLCLESPEHAGICLPSSMLYVFVRQHLFSAFHLFITGKVYPQFFLHRAAKSNDDSGSRSVKMCVKMLRQQTTKWIQKWTELQQKPSLKKMFLTLVTCFREYFQHEAAVAGSRSTRPEIFLTSPDTMSACADTAPVHRIGRAHVTLPPEITQEWLVWSGTSNLLHSSEVETFHCANEQCSVLFVLVFVQLSFSCANWDLHALIVFILAFRHKPSLCFNRANRMREHVSAYIDCSN